MKLPKAMTDYVALLNGELDIVDHEAVAAHAQAIAAAEAAAEAGSTFEERLTAKIELARLKADSRLETAHARRHRRLQTAFVQAANSTRYAALNEEDWIDLGIPAEVARQVIDSRAVRSAVRVSRSMVADWVATQNGQTFTKHDVIRALGGGSPNTVKAGVKIAIERGIAVTTAAGRYTVQ